MGKFHKYCRVINKGAGQKVQTEDERNRAEAKDRIDRLVAKMRAAQ